MTAQERCEFLYREICRQADEMVAYRKEIERLGGHWREIAQNAAYEYEKRRV